MTTPKQVLDLYYLDNRWHLMELAAFLDRLDRAQAAHPDDVTLRTDPRFALLREALGLLSRDDTEPGRAAPNRAERLGGDVFSRLDPKFRPANPAEE